MPYLKFIPIKALLTVCGLLFTAVLIAAESKLLPWDYDSNIYRNDSNNLTKDIQWDVCSQMALSTANMAGAVATYPETPELIRELFLEEYPLDNENFYDVINQKKIDLAFELSHLWNYETMNNNISQVAWDWCSQQDSSHFRDL
ncbi:hypothetical protein L1D40_05915 [Shewanella insulae]|uniref:hypothetical protein n=1 Tax=Shewanella insulae TaxID=2681496 RepID=UPI001EFE1584|nr:hypothetical protein [Shewanella insulae]MCG9712875.1 hypothetical protein [Shewanella insulae]MCG9754769.1 hypothetical protein [Shewanella insulae]